MSSSSEVHKDESLPNPRRCWDDTEQKHRELFARDLLATKGRIAFDLMPPTPKPNGWMSRMTGAQYDNYARKCDESDGFDVTGCTGIIGDGIGAMNMSCKSNVKLAAEVSKRALREHNSATGDKLQLVGIHKSMIQILGPLILYVTLKAVNLNHPDEPPKLYRAKVFKHRLERGPRRKPRRYEVKQFYLAPDQLPPEDAQTAGESNQESKTHRVSTRRQRPYQIFVNALKQQPEFEKAGYPQLMSAARSKWNSLSDADKIKYYKMAEEASGSRIPGQGAEAAE